MKRYKFTILGKSEETVEVDSLEILDGVFNFIVDGTILRSLLLIRNCFFNASATAPPEGRDRGGSGGGRDEKGSFERIVLKTRTTVNNFGDLNLLFHPLRSRTTPRPGMERVSVRSVIPLAPLAY